jgi:Ca2+-transporting ATPase
MSELQGLTQEEAKIRLRRFGLNILPGSEKISLRKRIAVVLAEPMVLLLFAGGLIYVFIGEARDALMLLGFLVLIVGITLRQELKAERALSALRSLSSPRALVMRDGRLVRVSGLVIVPGDIAFVSEGDRIPSDGKVIEAANLCIDESILTGESVPVRKYPEAPVPESVVYGATTVVSGRGRIEITATGRNSEIGKIGKAIAGESAQPARIQIETRRLVRILAFIAGSLCVVVFVGYWLRVGSMVEGFLAGLTLGMAILPNELPAVLVIFLSLGAWRLSKSGVLIRKMQAIETLGSATVLCVDKTGTLTENRMALCEIADVFAGIEAAYSKSPLPEALHEILEYAWLASQQTPFDPMELAIVKAAERALSGTEHVHLDWVSEKDYPLRPSLLSVSRVWKESGSDRLIVAAKGASEAIVALCHLSKREAEAVSTRVGEMAGRGQRVLGVAKAVFHGKTLPDEQHEFQFTFLGLVGLIDPLRVTTRAALDECQCAGVRVVMITGDHPVTAISLNAPIISGWI